MTGRHDTDTRIHAFLQEGPAELSPHTLADIRAGVASMPRRRPRHLGRIRHMPRSLLILAPVAAALLVASLAILGGGGPRPDAGPTPSASATPIAPSSTASAPSASPTPASAVVLPGEPWIMFNDGGGSVGQVIFIRPDGRGRHALSLPSGPGEQLEPEWSPDGEQIVYMESLDDSASIYTADADGTSGRLLADPTDTCPATASCSFAYPSWSPDGTRVAFTAVEIPTDGGPPTFSLRVVEVAGRREMTFLTSATELISHPSWAADSRRVAIELARYTGAPGETPLSGSAIAVVDLGAAVPAATVLTDWADFAAYPDFHPTEDRIVFSTHSLVDFGGTDVVSNIFTMAADGSGVVALTTHQDGAIRATEPSWTPDGTRILFTEVRGSSRIISLLDPATGEVAWATGSSGVQGIVPQWRPTP